MGKNLITTSIVLFLIITSIIWYISIQKIDDHAKSLIRTENTNAKIRLTDAEKQLHRLYDYSRKHVLFIGDFIAFDFKQKSSSSLLAQKLAKFLEVDRNYFQARFIDNQGMEIVRVENSESGTIVLPSDKLQNKGKRSYFRESIELKNDEVYVSPLDFNIERGKIEIPYRPTVRFFTPIYHEGDLQGIVGLNFNIKTWLNSFDDMDIGLLNSKNEAFYGNDKILFPAPKLNFDQTDENGNPYYFTRKVSLEASRNWTIFTKRDSESIQIRLRDFKSLTYTIAVMLTLSLLIFLRIIYSFYTKNIHISILKETAESSLQERDMLLKEIHHRVKNNLQVITSLLSLQSSFIEDDKVKALFRYGQYRINSMAMVHEMLYQSDNLSKINYGEYLHQLVSTLIISMKGTENRIALDINVEDLYLNIDTSIPLGLLVNEIVTNSLKYGFKNTDAGTISINVTKLQYPHFILHIADDGVGFPDDINFRNTRSLGLKLIHKLALQLRGNIEKDNTQKGTHYIISFQEIEQTS